MDKQAVIDFLVSKYYRKLANYKEIKDGDVLRDLTEDDIRIMKNWKYEADVVRELLAQIVMIELKEQGIEVHNHFTLVFDGVGMSFKNEPITRGS